MTANRARLLCASALAGVVATTAPAFAQDAAAVADAQVSEVIVTGSRIARKDYISESPIVTVGQDQITAVGMTTVENVLNQLPQFTPSNGAGTNTTNFVTTPGQAYANLRGLGPTRTLVLIDGRRVVSANPNGVVDLNIVPSFLVETIETITGGASAVYGSDAVAGVVNIKLRHDVEGLAVDAQYGQTGEGDAAQTALAILGGVDLNDRGNLSAVLTYDRRDGLTAADRDWSEIGYSIRTTGRVPSGAATILEGRFDPSSNAGGATNRPSQAALDLVFGGYGFAPGTVAPNSSLAFNADGTLFTTSPVRNFRGEKVPGFSDASYSFNSAPYRYLNLPLERYTLFAAGDYDLTDSVEAYGTLAFTTYEVSRQLGPASASDGAFPGPDIVMPVTNPYIPDDLAILLASRPDPTADFFPRRAFGEVGGRLSENQYDTLQLVGGLRGDFGGGTDWRWDAYASWGQMDHDEDQFGNVSRAAMRQLTFAADGGVALCGGFDIFGAGRVSPGCAAFISRDVTNHTRIEQSVFEVNVTGTLFQLPAGALKASFGAQARNDRFDYDPDDQLTGPDIVGFNPAVPVEGEINSREVYGELLVPLLADLPFARSLDLNLGGRIADYNTIGQTSAWKADFGWRPAERLLVRGGAQRAVRAPNIAELYSPQSMAFSGNVAVSDPCSGTPAAAVAALCAAQGVPAGYIQATTNYGIITGGNPDLSEETADSWTLGAVWAPRFDAALLRRLSVSLDYYEIEVEDAVGVLGVATIVNGCFNADGSNPTYDPGNFYCGLFERVPAGDITNVQLNQINLAGLRTTGWDFQLDWGVDLAELGLPAGAGKLDINLVLGKLESFERQVRPGVDFVDYAGSIGGDLSGGAFPAWKSALQATWAVGPAKAILRWRHIAAMTDAASVPVKNPTAVDAPDYDIFDLMGSWTFETPKAVTVRIGVNNLGDERPPYFTSYSNSNTDPSTYDVLGRRWFIGLGVKF